MPSTIRPVPHDDELPASEPPENFALYSEDEDGVSSNSGEQQPSASRDADYLPSTDSSNHKITEGELNDLIRDLEIPKNKAELLASMFLQWNLLHHSVKVKFQSCNFQRICAKSDGFVWTFGCNMSMEIHFLFSHLDFLALSCGAISDEHGEPFHQNISVMEHRYKWKWRADMSGDYYRMMLL